MTVPARAHGGQLRFIAALIVLPAIWLTMLLWGRGPADRAIYALAYVGDDPVLVPIARGLTALGEPTILIAASFLVALVLWLRGHRHLPLVFIAITMLGRAVSEVQKYLIARPRPDLETHLVIVKTSSFPSGHANSSMIFFLTLALVSTAGTRWQHTAVVAAVVVSLLVGASRVMLGVHWPSDVVGGWALGMFWVLVTLRLAGRFIQE